MEVTLDDIINLAPNADRYGHYIALCCPFHLERRASLLAYAPRRKGELGHFQCKSCGKSGNLEGLYNALQGFISPSRLGYESTSYDAPRLPTDLIEQEALALEAHRTLLQNKNHLGWYLEDRGVAWCIEPYGLGWHDGWYVMPVRDEQDQFQGMILRASRHVQETSDLRFHQPKGQGSLLYMPDRHLAEQSSVLFIVYGMFDALALATLRFPVCTTTAGKDSFRPEWLASFRKPVVVVPDYGEDQTARKLAGKLGWRGDVLELPYDDIVQDPADFLKHKRQKQLVAALAPYIGG